LWVLDTIEIAEFGIASVKLNFGTLTNRSHANWRTNIKYTHIKDSITWETGLKTARKTETDTSGLTYRHNKRWIILPFLFSLYCSGRINSGYINKAILQWVRLLSLLTSEAERISAGDKQAPRGRHSFWSHLQTEEGKFALWKNPSRLLQNSSRKKMKKKRKEEKLEHTLHRNFNLTISKTQLDNDKNN